MTDSGGEVVLGAAVGYSASQIAPFLRSLRNTGYAGAVALVVDRERVAEFSRLSLFRDVELLPARQWLPVRRQLVHAQWKMRWLWRPLQWPLWGTMRILEYLPFSADLRLRLQSAIAAILFPPSESRYFRYYWFLRQHAYARVLISDVRDVLFQEDPFRQLPPGGLAVGVEAAPVTIGSETWNSRWVLWGYGEQGLARIRDRPVACSGVTSGNHASMLHYLREMMTEMARLTPDGTQTSGIDQGIHNWLLWTGRLGTVTELRTLQSALATIGLVAEADLRLRADGRLQNIDGSLPAIVHQYDRWPAMAKDLVRALAAAPEHGHV